MLLDVAEDAEEWLTSAQSLGLAIRTGNDGLLPWDRVGRPLPSVTPTRRNGARAQRPVAVG